MSSEDEDFSERSEDENNLGESDESEEEISNKRKRKSAKDKNKSKKKRVMNQFIEEEADDDEDEDDDEEDEDGDLFGGENKEAEEAAMMYEEGHRRLNQERKAFETESAEEIVNRIKQKHRRSQRRFDDEDVGGEMMHSDVTQQSLLPSVSDPKMWIFKCKPGREQHLVVALMNKYIDFMNRGHPLQIKSAVASSTKGFIYIEAEREPHAKEAVTGLRDIMPWSMKLVPIHEMSSVLSIKTRRKPIVAGSFARMKRAGLYKGDLCKVLEVVDSGTRALIQLLPRLDPTVMAGGVPQRYNKGQRPGQNLFAAGNVQGEISRRRHPLTQEMMDVYESEFYKDGFLIKEVSIQTMLQTEDIVPTLDEMNKFNETSGLDGGGHGVAAWSKEVELAKGDTVRVIEGDLMNLMGVVVGTNAGNDTVKVMPLHAEIRDTILDFQLKQLMKYVKVGDHIKVVSGRYSGETGTVVSVDESSSVEPIAIVLVDSMAKEIQVRVRDVQESAEVSTGLDSLKGKELYDLVALPHGDVGVITHVGRESFKVILQTGHSRDVTDQEIQRKLQSSRAAALDKQKNHITPGEMVSVVDGMHKGQSGTIKHLYRSFVFLHNNKISTNSGIFVAKSRHVVLAGSRARSNITQNSMVNPTARPQRRNNNANREESDMMGKTVKIKKGRHKGYLGMVVEETEQRVKVEIHSKSTCVEVDKQHIILAGTRMGQIQDNPRTSATPMIGQTPMSSQTPLHGSMTPMHTPLHHGGTTPTPHTPGDAWNPAAKHSDIQETTDTPWGPTYGTPMDTPGQEATTPGAGFYNPATPGALSYSPAPDGMGGPVTPGVGYNPTTPAVGTPGGYQPNTPGGIIAPLTPATMESPMPSTPYGGPIDVVTESSDASASWTAPYIEVRIVAGGEYEGLVGSIQSVLPNGICIVNTGDQAIRIGADGLKPVTPEKHNRIRVLHGDGMGQTGSLIGTDGDDGIVKMDGTAEINIYNLSALAKLIQ